MDAVSDNDGPTFAFIKNLYNDACANATGGKVEVDHTLRAVLVESTNKMWLEQVISKGVTTDDRLVVVVIPGYGKYVVVRSRLTSRQLCTAMRGIRLLARLDSNTDWITMILVKEVTVETVAKDGPPGFRRIHVSCYDTVAQAQFQHGLE